MSEIFAAVIFCIDLYVPYYYYYGCEKLYITTPLHFLDMPFCLSGYLIKISSLGIEVDSLNVSSRPRM